MILVPTLKSLIFNPPPLLVWRNLLKYKISTFFKTKTVTHSPLSIVAYVTKRCNFSCNFCFTYSDLNKNDWKKDEMSIEQFSEIINSDFGKKSLRIGFLGGEPFLNPNLFTFLNLATKHGKITTIVTNASLVNEEHRKQLINNHPTMLGLSLYENNIEQVANLSEWLHTNKISFWVQTVIDSNSIEKMKTHLEFAKKHKIKNLIFSNYHPTFSKEYNLVIYNDNKDFQLESKKIQSSAKAYGIDLVLPQPLQRAPVKRNCQMPFSYIHVDASGRIGPCCFRAPNEKYGNIFKTDSWNNLNTQEIRAPFIDSTLPPKSECNYCENFSRDLYGV
jgi:radical SAM protein with 4Fe4S-binding SPASM domain